MIPMVIPEMITFLLFIDFAIIGTNRGEFISATELMMVVSGSILNIFEKSNWIISDTNIE